MSLHCISDTESGWFTYINFKFNFLTMLISLFFLIVEEFVLIKTFHKPFTTWASMLIVSDIQTRASLTQSMLHTFECMRFSSDIWI